MVRMWLGFALLLSLAFFPQAGHANNGNGNGSDDDERSNLFTVVAKVIDLITGPQFEITIQNNGGLSAPPPSLSIETSDTPPADLDDNDHRPGRRCRRRSERVLGAYSLNNFNFANLLNHLRNRKFRDEVPEGRDRYYWARWPNPEYSRKRGNAKYCVSHWTKATCPVNQPPVAYDGTATVVKNGSIAITLTASDPEGKPIQYEVPSRTKKNGTLRGTPPVVTYVPPKNFTGADSFPFTVKETGNSKKKAKAEVKITVTAPPPPVVNQPPVANAATFDVDKNGSVTITLTGSDPEGKALKYKISKPPLNGTLTGTPPVVTYKPIAHVTGPDRFKFTVEETADPSKKSEAEVQLNVRDLVAQNVNCATAPFGIAGIASFGTDDYEIGKSVSVLADKKIIVAGYTLVAGVYYVTVARTLCDGSPDITFGITGKMLSGIGTTAPVSKLPLHILDDGKIVVVSPSGAGTEYKILRLTSQGIADTSWGTAGIVTAPPDPEGAVFVPHGMAFLSDGRFGVAGFRYLESNTAFIDVFTASGTPFAGFEEDGRVVFDGPTNDGFNQLATYGTGSAQRFIAVGTAIQRGNRNVLVTGFSPDGTPTPLTTDLAGSESADAVLAQADGKVVVAGTTNTGGQNQVAILRYGADGSLDPDFGTAGSTIAAMPSGKELRVRSVIAYGTGYLVSGVEVKSETTGNAFVARFTAAGALDTSFGTQGFYNSPKDSPLSAGFTVALLPGTDGRIILAASTANGGTADFSLVRLRTDGKADTGSGGASGSSTGP